jgi:hypothetical protein
MVSLSRRGNRPPLSGLTKTEKSLLRHLLGVSGTYLGGQTEVRTTPY